MSILVSTIRTKYERFKHDISDVSTATFCDWCDAINKMLYNHLAGIDTERLISTQSYTVTSSPSTQALPTDFKEMTKFGTGLFRMNGSLDTTESLNYTEFGSSSTGYYLTGGNIVFTGIENEVYKMRYLPKVTTISALTAYFTINTLTGGVEIVPEGYEDLLIKFIDVYYSAWDEDIGMEGVADQRFIRLLDEFSRTVKRTPAVYGLDDSTINF